MAPPADPLAPAPPFNRDVAQNVNFVLREVNYLRNYTTCAACAGRLRDPRRSAVCAHTVCGRCAAAAPPACPVAGCGLPTRPADLAAPNHQVAAIVDAVERLQAAVASAGLRCIPEREVAPPEEDWFEDAAPGGGWQDRARGAGGEEAGAMELTAPVAVDEGEDGVRELEQDEDKVGEEEDKEEGDAAACREVGRGGARPVPEDKGLVVPAGSLVQAGDAVPAGMEAGEARASSAPLATVRVEETSGSAPLLQRVHQPSSVHRRLHTPIRDGSDGSHGGGGSLLPGPRRGVEEREIQAARVDWRCSLAPGDVGAEVQLDAPAGSRSAAEIPVWEAETASVAQLCGGGETGRKADREAMAVVGDEDCGAVDGEGARASEAIVASFSKHNAAAGAETARDSGALSAAGGDGSRSGVYDLVLDDEIVDSQADVETLPPPSARRTQGVPEPCGVVDGNNDLAAVCTDFARDESVREDDARAVERPSAPEAEPPDEVIGDRLTACAELAYAPHVDDSLQDAVTQPPLLIPHPLHSPALKVTADDGGSADRFFAANGASAVPEEGREPPTDAVVESKPTEGAVGALDDDQIICTPSPSSSTVLRRRVISRQMKDAAFAAQGGGTVVCTSQLPPSDRQMCDDFCRAFALRYVRGFDEGPRPTVVVTPLDKDRRVRTFSFNNLDALVSGIPVVGVDWLHSCEDTGALLPYDEFLTTTQCPKTDGTLFSNLVASVDGMDNEFSEKEMALLIRLGGGKVVSPDQWDVLGPRDAQVRVRVLGRTPDTQFSYAGTGSPSCAEPDVRLDVDLNFFIHCIEHGQCPPPREAIFETLCD